MLVIHLDTSIKQRNTKGESSSANVGSTIIGTSVNHH